MITSTLFSTLKSHYSLLKDLLLYSITSPFFDTDVSSKMPLSSTQIILTSSPDGPITAYDASSGATLAHFSGSRVPRHGLTLAGTSFIAASHISSDPPSGSIRLYNWWSSTALHNLPLPEPAAPLTATPDGAFLFAGGLSGNIHTLSVPSGDLLVSYPAHDKPVSCLAISEDKSLLISGGDDGTIACVPIFQLADVDANPTNLMLQKFVAHESSVTAIASCPTSCSSSIISCSTDCTCKFWRLPDGAQLRTVQYPCGIMGVAFHRTGLEFYAAGSDGFVYKGTLSFRGCEVERWNGKHEGSVVNVAMVNDGEKLVSAAEDGSVFIWEVGKGEAFMGLGNDMGSSISGVAVAGGVGDGGGGGGEGMVGEGGGYLGFCGENMVMKCRAMKETVDLEGVMRVAGEDRRRAIDLLESAIGIYENLLELILKEAKRGGSSSN